MTIKAAEVAWSFKITARKISEVNKFGYRFARKKRQMKKNKKRYGFLWKVTRQYIRDTTRELKALKLGLKLS